MDSQPERIETLVDAEELWTWCLREVQNLASSDPPPTSRSIANLLWSLTISHAHLFEIALRVYGPLHTSDLGKAVALAAKAMLNLTTAELHDMWSSWTRQRRDLRLEYTILVPVYFLYHQRLHNENLREISRQSRARQLPVYTAIAALSAGPVRPDACRIQQLLSAMDQTLQSTVHRCLKLSRDKDDGSDGNFSSLADMESLAYVGALEKDDNLREALAQAFQEQIFPDLQIPDAKIPELQIPGMNTTNGLNKIWRTAALNGAIRFLAHIAPGPLGYLETALPDAAHAAQRAVRDQADAKKRGGSGGEKAKKAGTADPPVQHLSIDRPQANPDLGRDAGCIDPDDLADEGSPSLETTIVDKDLAAHAMHIAVQRWGDSGRRMLEALQDGCTDKEAAERAGISAPALMKRRNKLKKLLSEL